jgi:hypothetical protein
MANESNKTDDRQKLNIWLEKWQVTALEKIREATFAPVSALIREAVSEYLRKKK